MLKGEFELYTEKEAFFNCAFLAALANGSTIIHGVKATPEFGAFADYLKSMGANLNVKEDSWEIEGTNFKCNQPLNLDWVGESQPYMQRNKKIIECLLNGEPFHCEEKIAVNDSLIRELASFGVELEWKLDGPDEEDELAKRMARAKGVKNERKWICDILPVRSLLARDRFVPGSVTEAAFLALMASIVSGSEILIKTVALDTTRAGIFAAFKRLGADIEVESRHEKGRDVWGNLRVKYSQELKGRRFNADSLCTCLEEIPLLAAMACFAEGESIFSLPHFAKDFCKPAFEILYKNFKSAGIECGLYEDGFILRGVPEINPDNFDCKGNAIVGLALHALNKKAKGKNEVIGIECIENIYPETINKIGA